jgi:hypothetical protein
MHPPRRVSAVSNAAAARPGTVKTRAYSAPLVPKNHGNGTEHDPTSDVLAGEPGEDDEIVNDTFFQRYNFPQETAHDASSSNDEASSSSDTEGPLSPTHVQGRRPGHYSSPQSPVPSVAVCFASSLLLTSFHIA